MTYFEYRKEEMEAAKKVPLFWAFTNEQFRDAMEQRGLTEKDTDKLYTIGGGGFYLKSDADKVHEYFNRKDRLKELMADPEFAEEAFYYEMGNHEYHLDTYQGDWDVCSCFGKCEWVDELTEADHYLKEMGYGDETVKAFYRARRKFMKYVNENDLW